MARAFVHTHVHSDYSLLDGAAKIPSLVEAAAKAGQPALALTDHGNLCGAIEFYKECRKQGVKPLVGIEAYLAPRSRFDREKNPVAAHHLVLIAQDRTGWQNLLKLSTRAFTEGFYYVPRVDKELLQRFHHGLIAQSACLSGEPAYYARNGDVGRATQAALEMRDLFGDRYYLEIQRNGCDGQEDVNQALLRIAREHRIPVVATNDVHYVAEEDALAHEVHMCIGMAKTLKDAKRLKPESLLCFRPTEPMYALFADVEDAARATEEIASRCDLTLDLKTRHLPAFTAPGGEDNVGFFRRLCREGIQRRYGSSPSPAVLERLEHEQRVIEQMGFVPYFLITWDFVAYARREGIPVGPGRGSAAGSIVAYALGITSVDPLRHDLLFERFLNPERISMPDIDIDFCKDGREKVIRYVQEKYGGPDRVSQIITFGTMAARAVIRDVGRVLDVPLRDVDALAKKVPTGPKATLAHALETDPDLRKEVAENEAYRRLIDIARRLEGFNRNASKHAAGVVIADAPLEEYVPLYRVGKDVTTQFSMEVLEDIGLLKMDFLGLRTLTILAKTLDNIRRGGREPPDLDHLPPDDPETFAMLSAEALGVFQLESSGMRDLLRRIRPDRFEDLSIIVALYRPGPMGSGMMDMYIDRKNGREPVTYPHPLLEGLLRETQGVVVYQEQVMRVANLLAGFSLSEADNLRKAMGKKKPEILARFQDQFVTGCAARGVAEARAREIWAQLEHFAGYGFNKSHTVAYAVVTYQTAYLKRHFPREFMAALLTCEMADMDKVTEYVDEARRLGIEILPPDVSHSDPDFLVEGQAIRYGLAAIKGVGDAAAAAIRAARPEGGFRSVFDLCERVALHAVNHAVLEALTKAGAFDGTGARRAQVAAVLERAMRLGTAASEDRSTGQLGLFGAAAAGPATAEPDYADVPDWPDAERMAWERELIGYYATDHPLARHERLLRRLAGQTAAALRDLDDRAPVRLGGMIRQPRTSVVKSGPNEGRKMAFFQLEDFTGSAECVVFSRTYAEVAALVTSDRVVLLEGHLDRTREEPSVQVDRLIAVEDAPRVLAQGVLVRLGTVGPEALDRLRETITVAPGDLPLLIEFQADPTTLARVKAGPSWRVAASDELIDRLASLPEVEAAEYLARAP